MIEVFWWFQVVPVSVLSIILLLLLLLSLTHASCLDVSQCRDAQDLGALLEKLPQLGLGPSSVIMALVHTVAVLVKCT